MADLKPHAEVMGAVVEKKNGKDAVMDNGANELGGAVEKGLKIESCVEGVSELGQIGNVGRLHACIDRVKVGVGVEGVNRAIVALDRKSVVQGKSVDLW